MQTRLTDGVKVKIAILKRKMADANPDCTQRRSPRVKAACQTAANKADGDTDAVKIGPSTLGGSPVHRSQRVLAYNKPSSSPLPEHSSLKENKKRKVATAKVNKGVKKRACVEAEDPAFEGDDLEVNFEDEDALPVNVRSPAKQTRGRKQSAIVDEGDSHRLNIIVRCSLK